MTKTQLTDVFAALIHVIHARRESSPDDDPEGVNDRICLTLRDDGSGRIGTCKAGNMENWHGFQGIDGLLAIMVCYGVEDEEPGPDDVEMPRDANLPGA